MLIQKILIFLVEMKYIQYHTIINIKWHLFFRVKEKSLNVLSADIQKELESMKKQTMFLFLLCLTSCNHLTYAKEIISRPKTNNNTEIHFSDTEKSSLKTDITFSSDSDFILSPLGASLIDSYQNKPDLFQALYQKANRKEKRFSLSSVFSVASTSEITEKNTEGVSYFEGSLEELSNSLSRYYNRKMTLTQNGTYYLNETQVTDQFTAPQKVKKDLPFRNSGQYDYVEFLGDYELIQNENYTYLALTINKTEMRLVLPKENHPISEFAFDVFYQENPEKRRIHALVPKFEKKYSYLLETDERFLYQENEFHFDEFGIKASSFSVNGPTSVNPSYTLELTFDQPFLYSCFYDDVMLFCGAISSL